MKKTPEQKKLERDMFLAVVFVITFFSFLLFWSHYEERCEDPLDPCVRKGTL